MSVELNDDMPGLGDLSARLDAAEASDAVEAAAGKPQEQRDESTERAGAALQDETLKPVPKPTDTPAAADKSKDESPKSKVSDAESTDKKSDLPGDKPADTKARDSKGQFAKAQERLHKTWDNVNARKTELDTQAQTLTQRETQLQQQQEEFERKQSTAQQQYQPEQYEQAATQKAKRAEGLHAQADGIEARAKKLEDDGDFTKAAGLMEEAKKIRKAAFKEEGNADDLKAHAEELRKNPPPTAKAAEEKLEGQRKEWTMKAATDFPELGKKDSELQKTVAGHLKALWETDRALASNPQIIYHVTRLAAAETAAARVPGMEKELAQAKAKVKELEGLTAPGGAGSTQRITESKVNKTDAEEGAELRQMASELGEIPR